MTGDVRVHVASANTRPVTELCVRSMRRFAGRDFDLVVGDGGSLDGSIRMLRRLERAGFLELEVSSWWQQHTEWLDGWLATCEARYCVFSDSDVEFRAHGWLSDMVSTAEQTCAAIVTVASLPEQPGYRHPTTHRLMRVAARPAVWLMLVDAERLRSLGVSFAARIDERADLPEGAISYDTGALMTAAAEAAGLGVVAMPDGWHKAHHFGSLSWIRSLRGREARDAARKTALIRLRLMAYRVVWRTPPTRQPALARRAP